MPLTKKEIDGLLELVALTRDDELNCEGCLSEVADFVERELGGKSIPDGLRAVEHHLAVCED